jgi:hypothetical protein
MSFPIPSFNPPPPADPHADVRTVAREDVQWNRPIFKAPPLEYFLRGFDAKLFAQELRSVGLVQR